SKLGAGTLFLTNSYGSGGSTYTGQTTIAGGALNVQSGTALGASSNVIVATGALQLQSAANLGGFTMSRPLFLYGSGMGSNGALENVFGTNVFNATTLNGSATIGVDAGALTQGGVMSGPGDLTKVGGGTLVLNQANTYFGQTNINNGVVQITAQAFALG